jgi:DNA-binding transcriptional LysR family regulator
MKSLEEAYGLVLFEYYNGHVHLTQAGIALSAYAKKILELYEESKRVMNEFQSIQRGHLSLGASSVPGVYVLPARLGYFKRQMPHATLSLAVETAPKILDLLADHQIDIAIVSHGPEFPEGLVARPLMSDELVLAYANSFNGSPMDLEALRKWGLILHSPKATTRQMVDQWAKHIGYHPNIIMELGATEAIKEAAIQGLGVAILSKKAIEKEVHRGELIEAPLPSAPIPRGIYIVYNEQRYLTPLMTAFIELLTSS